MNFSNPLNMNFDQMNFNLCGISYISNGHVNSKSPSKFFLEISILKKKCWNWNDSYYHFRANPFGTFMICFSFRNLDFVIEWKLFDCLLQNGINNLHISSRRSSSVVVFTPALYTTLPFRTHLKSLSFVTLLTISSTSSKEIESQS